MSVAFTRISSATIIDIQFYDPAAERRADSLNVSWDEYFDVGSQDILYQMEFSWWPKYVENALGANYYKNNSKGELVSGFETCRLLLDSQILKQLDTYKAIELFYCSLVTDVSNVNEVDLANYKFARKRFDDMWNKAIALSNFYNLFGDDDITKLEENYNLDVNYLTNDQRYF